MCIQNPFFQNQNTNPYMVQQTYTGDTSYNRRDTNTGVRPKPKEEDPVRDDLRIQPRPPTKATLT